MPEILLITYSCPELPGFFLQSDRKNWVEVFEKTAKIYSSFISIPLIISNKTGTFKSPVPGIPLLRANAEFVGRSAIVDKNGKVLSTLKEGAGVLLEEVELGHIEDLKKCKEKLPRGRWLLPYTNTIKTLMEFSYWTGMLRYNLSNKRKKAARKRNSF
jgi:predicted amidohydrolase